MPGRGAISLAVAKVASRARPSDTIRLWRSLKPSMDSRLRGNDGWVGVRCRRCISASGSRGSVVQRTVNRGAQAGLGGVDLALDLLGERDGQVGAADADGRGVQVPEGRF